MEAFFTPGALAPYRGRWDYAAAAHLLRRTTFAPSNEEVLEALEIGLEASISRLLADGRPPEHPVNYNNEEDEQVPIGETWVFSPYREGFKNLHHRHLSLRSWLMACILNERFSMREKMTYFWHNHFGARELNDPLFMYDYNTTLRRYAFGNFKNLVSHVSVSPQMLVALDGFLNEASEPNENYAREFLELYTIGKGKLVGPGDYATYTEHDVAEIAKVFSGWRVQGFLSKSPDITCDSFFVPERHDFSDKQLSHRFGEEVIHGSGEREFRKLIDVIFRQPEVAQNLCRKLYRFFVYRDISAEVERQVIEPLAQLLIASNFEVRPVLESLLTSEHFFSLVFRGAMVKGPLEYVVSVFRQLEVPIPPTLSGEYSVLHHLESFLPKMMMKYWNPPTVAGWGAYYQGPSYQQLWLSSSTLNARNNFAYNLTISSFELPDCGITADPFTMLQCAQDPSKPLDVIKGFAKLMLPFELSDGQIEELEQILMKGWAEEQWREAIDEYNPEEEPSVAVRHADSRLRKLLFYMANMPEFHLS